MRTVLFLSSFALLVACGDTTPTGGGEVPGTPETIPEARPERTPESPPDAPPDAPPETTPDSPTEGDLPTPHTAEQIRDASKLGRTWEFRVTAGTSTQWRILEMTEVDAVGAVIRRTVRGGEGQVSGAPTEDRATWEEMRLRGAFPATDTTVSRDTVKAFGGPYEAQRYTVRRDVGTETFWFADVLPGPPVKATFEKDGVVERTELLMKYRPGDGKP